MCESIYMCLYFQTLKGNHERGRGEEEILRKAETGEVRERHLRKAEGELTVGSKQNHIDHTKASQTGSRAGGAKHDDACEQRCSKPTFPHLTAPYNMLQATLIIRSSQSRLGCYRSRSK